MMINVIYMAAGLSARFGKANKLLYEIGGVPMYRHCLDKLLRIADKDIRLLVVTNTKEIAEYCRQKGVPFIPNAEAAEGISSTIKTGIRYYMGSGCGAQDEDRYVFMVADQPFLSVDTIARFFRECKNSELPLGCTACADRLGNPAWFAAEYVPELLKLEGDKGGKKVMMRYPEKICRVEVNERELEDIDIPGSGV